MTQDRTDPDHHAQARDWAALANRLGRHALDDDRPTRWVDDLWSAAERDEVDLPWDRSRPFDVVADAIADLGPGDGRRAVVVGAALGADAEALAAAGWTTVAFDVSPAAVRLVQERHPESEVDYRLADLLDLPDDLVGAFDLVIEVFTVQAMPPTVRDDAQASIRRLLAPGGQAVVVQHVRGGTDPLVGPPWMLDRTQMEAFAAHDVSLTSLVEDASPRADRTSPVWVARLVRR